MTHATEAARLRALLSEKKAKKATATPLRFAYMLDPELAGRVEMLAESFARIEDLVESRREQLAAVEESGGRDLRASGDDTTPEAAKLAAAEAEMERLKTELDAAIEKATADRFYIEFKPCGDRRYTQLLASHPEACEDNANADARADFQNALLAECFWRFTDNDGNELPLFDSWTEFVTEAEPEFGEMDAWRTAVMVACNRNPHRLLPR